jgi:hypothetical protein
MVPSPAFHLTGNSVVGVVKFQVSGRFNPGQWFKVRIARASGGQDMDTSVTFDSIPGSVWPMMTPPSGAAETTSDEWRANFFGTTNSPASAQSADPDNDGVSNSQEYAEGTDPLDANSYLHLERTDDGVTTTVSWLSAPKKVYVIEQAGNASGPWTAVTSGVVGDGYVKQTSGPSAPFYRIRVQP